MEEGTESCDDLSRFIVNGQLFFFYCCYYIGLGWAFLCKCRPFVHVKCATEAARSLHGSEIIIIREVFVMRVVSSCCTSLSVHRYNIWITGIPEADLIYVCMYVCMYVYIYIWMAVVFLSACVSSSFMLRMMLALF